jgi:hypothetical protein
MRPHIQLPSSLPIQGHTHASSMPDTVTDWVHGEC